VCCLVFLSRHLLTRPGRYSAPAAYHQSALRSGAYDFPGHLGHDPCHGASAVPECPRTLPVTTGSDGWSKRPTTSSLRLYAHEPRRLAAAVPWCLYGSDCHGAARMEDMAARIITADRARRHAIPESNGGCVICFRSLFTSKYHVSMEPALITASLICILNQRINGGQVALPRYPKQCSNRRDHFWASPWSVILCISDLFKRLRDIQDKGK
jgi:hypothetical protein